MLGSSSYETVQEIVELVDKIKPLLAHHEPPVQSAVLAELLSMWLAGHYIPDDPESTEQVRAELLANHYELVRALMAVNDMTLRTG